MSRASSMAARARVPGIILAYDEAQCLSDHAERNEFPLSMLLDTVASGQKKPSVVPCLLILCGLPHLLNALTDTRTYRPSTGELTSIQTTRSGTMLRQLACVFILNC